MAKSRLSSSDYDDQWRVCGMHVERAALMVSYFSLILDALIIILALYMGKWGIAVVVLFFMMLNSTVLCAKGRRHKLLYWPYLITNAIGLFLTMLMIGLLIYNLAELPDWWMQWVDPVPERHGRTERSTDKVIWTTAVLLVFFILYGLLYSFFQYVIWKAYKFMKRYPQGFTHTSITSTTHGPLITSQPIGGTTVVTVEEQTITSKTTA